MFSRGFISFSKSKDIAEEFIYNSNKNTLLILTNPPDKNEIFAQADIHFLSDIEREQEVLFFPFAIFGIEDFKKDENKQYFIATIKYMGKLDKVMNMSQIVILKIFSKNQDWFLKIEKSR